jgi:DNA-binding transcriptional LysR family regulator
LSVDVSAHGLRYFVAVAEEGHMGRAAERLHLATPSLSEQVARLERQVGASLFIRTGRGVELTDAGRELLPLARAAVEAHEAVGFWSAGRARAQSGVVRVGVFAAAGGPLRSAVLSAIQQDHPDLDVRTRRVGVAEGLTSLRERRLDVAYLPQPLPARVTGVRWTTVTRQQRLLVVPTAHRLANRDRVSIEETNDEVFIPLAGVDDDAVAWWLVDPRADGSHPARGPVASDFEEMLDMCAAGKGLVFTSTFAATNYTRPGLAFVPLEDVEDSQTALCWRADEGDAAVRTFVATVRRLAPHFDQTA